MNKADQYRLNAERCRQKVAGHSSQFERAAWLEMADSWMRLAEFADQGPGGATRRRAFRPFEDDGFK